MRFRQALPLGVDATSSPLFVVGCGRSGTTLLRLMLNQHSELAIFGETQAFFLFGKYGPLTVERSHLRFIRDWQEICALSAPNPEMMSSIPLQKQLGEAKSYAAAVSRIMGEFLSQERKHRWGEKTPAHVHQISSISRAYPKAKFIHLTRDPRAVVNSAISELGDGVYNLPSINKVVRYWNRCEAAIERASKTMPDRILKIRYEDLIEKPEQSLQTMCRFLGVGYEAEMLNTAESAKRDAPRQNANGPIASAHLGLLANINSTSLDKWRKRLDPASVGVIDHLAEAWMKVRGYSREPLAREMQPSLKTRFALYVDWQLSEARRLIERYVTVAYWRLRILFAA